MIFGVHPDNGLPYVDDGSGHMRVLACLPATKEYSHLPKFSSAFPILPESQWIEFEDLDDYIPILDQDGHGSCVGHGSCSAFQVAWSQARETSERFSPCFLYSQINGGRDNGAVVGDAMDQLMKGGICLETTVPEGNVIFDRQLPSTAKLEAERFKLAESYRVSSFPEIMTAIQMRRAVSIGIDIGQAFEPDSSGKLPSQRGGGGGHCLCLRFGAKKFGANWYIKGQNSWGTKWGAQGRFWMDESYFRSSTDHFVPQAPGLDPQNPKKPPVAK